MTLDLSDLTRVRLTVGSHRPNGNACVMEAVSLYAGEPWSAAPRTTDPALAAFLRVVNDKSPQWVRDELALRIPRIARAHFLPPETRWIWAEAARQSAIRMLGPVRGESLAACAPIVDMDTARTAAYAARAAADSAFAAYAAYAAADAAHAAADTAADADAYAANAAHATAAARAVTAAAAYAAAAADTAADAYADAANAAAAAADAAAYADEWREALALVDRMLDLADRPKEGKP